MVTKTITILDKKVTIKLVEDLKKDEYRFGDFCREKYIIRLDASMHKKELEATLLHEICHAALWISGISHLLKDDLEETVVTCLENALVSHIDGLKHIKI